MEASELREHIQQKISEGPLPRDISALSTYPVDVVVKEARGEPCSVCGRPIDPPLFWETPPIFGQTVMAHV